MEVIIIIIMHHALLAAGLLPLAFASPVDKHKTSTTTVTLAPVSTSTEDVPGAGTIVHSWVVSDTPAPVAVSSTLVVPAEPSTTHWSSVFTLHDSSVVQGPPSSSLLVSMSQPKPKPTEVHVTSVVHPQVPTETVSTVVVSKPSAKPKPLFEPEITDTSDHHGKFKLKLYPDPDHGNSNLDWPFAGESENLTIFKMQKDIWVPTFGKNAGVEAFWDLNKGQLQTFHDDSTMDTFYWRMIDLGKACKKHPECAIPGWSAPILTTNQHKKKFASFNRVGLGWKKDWKLVRDKKQNRYQLVHSKQAGGWIYCPKFLPYKYGDKDLLLPSEESAGLFWGTNAWPGTLLCEHVNLYVSIPVSVRR